MARAKQHLKHGHGQQQQSSAGKAETSEQTTVKPATYHQPHFCSALLAHLRGGNLALSA